MFDANGVVCTDIHKATLEVLSSDEVLKMSVCRITSPKVFVGESPHSGGLHDPAMGSLDTRIPCATCGLRRDCPGHLGHIEFPLYVYHPTLISSLVRLLKMVCFHCCRLKIDERTASVFVKKFQLLKNGMLEDAEKFEFLHGHSSSGDRFQRMNKGVSKSPTHEDIEEEKRVQLIQLFLRIKETEEHRKVLCQSLQGDISETHTSVEAWTTVRRKFLSMATSRFVCSHCNRVFSTNVKQKPGGVGIQLTWAWGSEKPFSRLTNLRDASLTFLKSQETTLVEKKKMTTNETVTKNERIELTEHGSEEDEETMIHGRRGRVIGCVEFQSYHLIYLLKSLWNSPDRDVLEFLYPMSIKNSWEMFFIRYLPVSSNRFRPLSQGPSFGKGSSKVGSFGQQSTLHIRTCGLLEILTASLKLETAIKNFKQDVLVEDQNDSKNVSQDIAKDQTKSRVKKRIVTIKEKSTCITAYCNELQQYVNQYIDSTKTLNTRGKRLTPGLRQWMERKEGAIRQKMMGKRVNFVARTVVAPDNTIQTNEIGIPLEFAMKLTIPEYVTSQSASWLQKLVENGARQYPGANRVEDCHGHVYDLAVMTDEQRLRKARLLFSNFHNEGLPHIVYRHVRDGDVVIMNRQPTLHRASIMAHFIRVLPGWKTFRLMYVNCASYNADFDGDEMNMHLPQDPTSQAEAKLLLNADNQYITVKNGEPLRGLIQDHVLGGAFLTCRNTFLDKNQYSTLVYAGLSSFVDSGSRMALEGMSLKNAWSCETSHGNVIFKCFPSSSRVMCQLNGCIKIHLEPPVVWKPKQLWTGKQVITSILKTVVDTIARLQFSKNSQFLQQYQGIHFKANSKTPGDAWGGVLDGDDEESVIIISDSELLQGVFDKSMFGASCFGLIHLIHELLGPSTAGLLLGIFAKTFTCFLQMRGFSCCVGDFLMTEEGQQKRHDMIRRCILAGNFIQEILVDTISKDMNFNARLMPKKECKEKLRKVHQIMLESQQDQLYYQKTQNASSLPCSVLMSHPFPMSKTSHFIVPKEQNIENNHKFKSQDEGKINLSRNSTLLKIFKNINPWNETRESHIPLFHGNREQEFFPEKIMETMKNLITQIFQLSSGNEKQLQELCTTLAQNKDLAIFFPHVAQLVGANRLWTIEPQEYFNKDFAPLCFNSLEDNSLKLCHSIPEPNRCCILSNGQVVMGDGALRLPQLYHPSYLYQKLDGFEFEDVERYKCSLLKNQPTKHSKAYKQHDMFSLVPNELTRYRLEQLALCQFPGKENTLIKIIDGFFQTVMGKLTSTNNDLVSGKATLYKFPENGFASMITTGAKGSKVNFAMICGMLSQQSLEGRRIPVMVSGKTLPSFGFYDFGTRAGGLITDCYLQGLRPQEYFFHCMAGREGLVDTAVKTARSGYLQRCVMKGMEGILVQYDGTVRDSDGSIIQFLYGEDGIDISKASYTKKLDDLLQNPVIIKAKFASDSKLKHSKVSKSLHSIHQWVKQTKNYSFTDSKSQWMENEKFVSIHDPISNVFPFRKYVGCSSEKYFQRVKQLIKQDPHDFLSRYMALTKNTSLPIETNHFFFKKQRREAKQTLKNLLLIKYSEGLCAPGEAVGCIAAQSMGEPATQMTLNTFHLAGHGAANVTLGIPRLREILQTAGKTKTPMVYAPVLGDTYEEAMKNADIALKGFKRIPLSDVIHAIGVESNFYCQPSKNNSKVKNEGERQDTFYWEYETTIQFENLDHFCLATPQFTPQHVITFTLNHLVRDMAKQVNRLVYLYASSYAEEVLDSEDDELECASNRFIFDRNIRSHFTRRDLRKERARVAGVGYLKKTVGQTSSIDLMTNVDVKESLKGGTTEANTNDNEFLDDTTISRENQLKEEAGDSDNSTDDSEKDFSDSEKDIEEKKENFLVDGEETEKDDESSLSHGDSSTTGDDKDLSDKDTKRLRNEFFNKEDSQRKKEMKKKWKELGEKQSDNAMNSSKTTSDTPEISSKSIQGSVLHASGKTIKLKPLPNDAYRFLTDIKVSRECWTIQVKFGWPYKKCPRRVVLLNDFVTMIKKYKLQDIPGITNPRIITGNQTETKVHCEVQCEGSNFGWIFGLRDTCIDHTRVTTNDIRTLLDFLGVEACRTSIIRELNKVFSVYGISVDYRHMSLIADTMTHSGYFRPFSRLGIQHHSSPLLQMSFETSMKFLTDAIQRGALDNLKTPAGAIVTGRPVLAGTGICRILTNIDAYKNKNVSNKKVKTGSEQRDVDTVDNATTLFRSKTKKRLTKEMSNDISKKQKFVFS